MRIRIVFLLCLGLYYCTQAQGQSLSTLSPAGSSAAGNTLTLDWTLGELAVQTLSTSNGILTEGFHQPSLVVETNLISPVDETLTSFHIQVAPNPVRSELNIRLESEQEGEAIIDLWNLQGQHLKRIRTDLAGGNWKLDMKPYPSGIYQLTFRNKKGSLIQTFKVSKIH